MELIIASYPKGAFSPGASLAGRESCVRICLQSIRRLRLLLLLVVVVIVVVVVVVVVVLLLLLLLLL